VYCVIDIRTGHNHPPNPDKSIVRQVKTTLRKRAKEDPDVRLHTIYQQETAQLANNQNAAALMPVYRNVSTTMQRERLSTIPKLPLSRQTLTVPPLYQVY
jgi:hypothetical protein